MNQHDILDQTLLDSACNIFLNSPGLESDLLEYYRELVRSTLYLPIVSVIEALNLQTLRKDLPLYTKTLVKCDTKEELVLAFDTYDRLQSATNELFKGEVIDYIALPAVEVIKQINFYFGLNINFSISNFHVVLSKNELQQLSKLSLEDLENKEACKLTDNVIDNLFIGIEKRNYQNTKRIIININDMEIRDSAGDGATLLISAAASGSLPIVELLVENGADISATDELNRTALHHAAMAKYNKIVDYLLQKKL